MRRRTALMAFISMASIAAHGAGTAQETGGRPWTVEDSLNIRYVVADINGQFPNGFDPGIGPTQPVVAAPDGRHFFFLTFRPDAARDCVMNEIHVYATADVARALRAGGTSPPLRPNVHATLCSNSMNPGFQAIGTPRWQDNDTILFSGVEGGSRIEEGAHRSIYRLTLASGRLERLTGDDRAVSVMYDAGGGSTFFMAYDGRYRLESPTQYPVQAMRGSYVHPYSSRRTGEQNFYASYRGQPARKVAKFEFGFLTSAGVRVSPDGRWALAPFTTPQSAQPDAWRNYAGGQHLTRFSLGALRYMLVDLQAATYRPVLDAPMGYITNERRLFARPIASATSTFLPDTMWTADSRHAILVNTALPLDQDQAERRRTAYIIDFEPESGAWRPLMPLETRNAAGALISRVRQVGWIEPGRVLLVTQETAAGRRIQGVRYTYRNGSWSASTASPSLDLPPPFQDPQGNPVPLSLADGVQVRLRQGNNEPPIMVASNGRREVDLLPPDPALAGLRLARRETIQWRAPNGRMETGSLVLPPDYVPGASPPPPLVIQAYYAADSIFQPDGNFTTGHAAQAMAAQGIAILYISGWGQYAGDDFASLNARLEALVGSTEELELRSFRDRIDAAVDGLAERGLIDRDRVGLIGFSRTCLLSYYAITHPGRTRIAASIFNDGTLHGFHEYSLDPFDAVQPGVPQFDRMYGDRGSLWENRQGYLAGMPIFNVEQIRGAVMLQYVNDLVIPATVEHVGAFRRNHVPWEFLLFGPEGYHQLNLPAQRRESMQAAVDWMNFWLQGRENPEPRHAARNAEWRRQRDVQRRQEAWYAAGHPRGSTPPSDFQAPAG